MKTGQDRTNSLGSKQPAAAARTSKVLTRTIIDKIMDLRDENGHPLQDKYSVDSILVNMEKHQIQIVQLFSKYMKEGFNLLQFVRFFMNIIPHRQLDNLHLTIGLVDLFRQITLETHRERVILKDLTDYMCDKILKKDGKFNKIEAKLTPLSQFFSPSQERRQFLQMPPTVYGQNDDKIYKLCQKSIKTDSSKHSRAILKSQYSQELKRIFILDALSDSISVFDQDCSLIQKISPMLCKLKKEVIILSFAFSRRQLRLGAVLKDFSLKFWDHFNHFEYEKSISTTSTCQNLQTSIQFLQYFNVWITTDRTGTIHFWDILHETTDRTMKCKYSAPVNGICQIPSLNLLVVVQECKRNSKVVVEAERVEPGTEATVVLYNYFNSQIITEINLQGMRIPHTLLYSETYQVLFMSGLEKKIRVYDLHPVFMDASLKGELIGHQNLITCFTLLVGTPMLVSADDKGKVKLWDFRSFTCLQTLDFSDKTIITNLLSMITIGKLGVFGSRVNYIDFEDRYTLIKKQSEAENLRIEGLDFDPSAMEMYLFANRSCRVIDLRKGQVKHIFTLSHGGSDQELTAFRYFANHKKIVLGNSNGQISILSGQSGEFESTLRAAHDGAVSVIDFDEFNKLYVSLGDDSKILVHRASDGSLLRQLKNNFLGKEVHCSELSVYHNIIVIGNHHSHCLYIWNYEFGKIIGEIKLPESETPNVLHIINGFGLLVVGTNSGSIYLFRTIPNSIDIDIQLLSRCSLGRGIHSIYSDLKLAGKGKNSNCKSCQLLVYCERGQLMQFDLGPLLEQQQFRVHCKQKTSYNPYRECKENFSSELQKQKHFIFTVPAIPSEHSLGESVERSTELSSLNICKMLKMEQSYFVVAGNDRRLKIWSQQHQLLCDLNVNYSLPYQWDLRPTSRTLLTEKVYYSIRVLDTISKKYQHDISIGEAKNLEIKELLAHIQDDSSRFHSRTKMITEPQDMFLSKQGEQSCRAGITLLQNEYSRKDLHFELVKRFNFTEVAGPTLKQLDNIRKIDNLQREWRIKEQSEQKDKESLLKNIQNKAKKNEEKDEIQFLFVKHKKTIYQAPRQDNEKIISLAKKLDSIGSKTPPDPKPYINPFYKSIYHRITHKIEPELKTTQSDTRLARSTKDNKISFEQYYSSKFTTELRETSKKDDRLGFREILTEMNGRVNSIKKYRYRRTGDKKQSSPQISGMPNISVHDN